MKKFVMYLLLMCTIIINIYLIFYWQPQNKIIIEEDASKETISYAKSIYKLDKEKALEQLSANDKRDFEKIIKKLSTYDIGKIKEYYEDSNEEEGIRNIFRLLQKRLTKEDYKRIQEISSSFVYLEKIN